LVGRRKATVIFVDQVYDKIGHDRKRARCNDVSEVGQCLFTWFVQKFVTNKNFTLKKLFLAKFPKLP
jgi:hypothetical protein